MSRRRCSTPTRPFRGRVAWPVSIWSRPRLVLGHTHGLFNDCDRAACWASTSECWRRPWGRGWSSASDKWVCVEDLEDDALRTGVRQRVVLDLQYCDRTVEPIAADLNTRSRRAARPRRKRPLRTEAGAGPATALREKRHCAIRRANRSLHAVAKPCDATAGLPFAWKAVISFSPARVSPWRFCVRSRSHDSLP